ncbi:hypothetical protein TNCV_2884781 [Trichonephila clavipes]|nr:hypothetical protein TNCV_2884781 [Trichonephila clavipes]
MFRPRQTACLTLSSEFLVRRLGVEDLKHIRSSLDEGRLGTSPNKSQGDQSSGISQYFVNKDSHLDYANNALEQSQTRVKLERVFFPQ